jgi:hypothetical protein
MVYTQRSLSFSKDRLPAIAGLAAAFGAHVEDEYLGGIWRKGLARQLLWVSVANGDAPEDASELVGPSWSWCSVSKDIVFHEYLKFDYEVLGADYSADDPQIPFGPGHGVLTLRGRLLPLTYSQGYFVGHTEGALDTAIHFENEDALFPDCRPTSRGFPDITDKPIFFFLTDRQDSAIIVECNGLLLRHSGKYYQQYVTFERIGFMEAIFNEDDINSSWDHWEKRFTTTTIHVI